MNICPIKVKVTLVQALRLCTGRTAHSRSRGIAILFHDHGTRRGWGISSRPGRSLPPGKTRYPLYRRLGRPQGRSGQVRKISPPPGFDPRAVQPVASRYTDWATRLTFVLYFCINYNIDSQQNNRPLPTIKKHLFTVSTTVFMLMLIVLVSQHVLSDPGRRPPVRDIHYLTQ